MKIKENIEFHKSRIQSLSSVPSKSEETSIKNLEEKATELERLRKKKEAIYLNEIKGQKLLIEKLSLAHKFLEEKIEESWKKKRKDEYDSIFKERKMMCKESKKQKNNIEKNKKQMKI